MKGVRLELPSAELARMNKMFKGKAKEINAEAQKGMNTVAMRVADDAKKTLKENGSIATSQLINSIFIRPQTDSTIDVKAEANHAYWVEFGRKPGKLPPIKPILEWIKKKGLADTYSIKNHKRAARGSATSYSVIATKRTVLKSDYYKRAIAMAWAIAKSINSHHTKARPFLFPAFRKNKADMMRVIGDAIKRVI